MKHAVILTLLCVLAMSAVALSADGPKLVGEKVILTLDKNIVYNPYRGIYAPHAMRLSPDGLRVLYLRSKWYLRAVSATRANGPQLSYRSAAAMVTLRDLKTGKDTFVPVPALLGPAGGQTWMSLTMFDPSGKRLIVPVCKDRNGNRYTERGEKVSPGLYDIASGKLTTLDIEGDSICPSFHPDGKSLVVTVYKKSGVSWEPKLYVSPTDKIKFRTLSQAGVLRSISPTSNLIAMQLFTEGERPRPKNLILYDLKTDTAKSVLVGKYQGGGGMQNNPQWTSDGRYIYHVIVKDEQRDGRRQRKILTRIWDTRTNKEVGLLPDVAPVGPGPGKGTMVLVRFPAITGPRTLPKIVLHAQDNKTLGKTMHPLGDISTYPISTQGKWLLFVRIEPKGKKTVCIAEISLPKK